MCVLHILKLILILLQTKVLNFYLGLAATNTKSFEMISANLLGPSIRQVQRVAAKRRSSPFITFDRDAIITLVTSHLSKIRTRAKDMSMRVAFSCGVDATALVKAYQISSSHCAIVGGAHPNHFISLHGKTKTEAFKLLKECQDGKHGALADEIKVAVLCFQNTPTNMSPYFVLVGRPQTTNESNNFGLMGKLL